MSKRREMCFEHGCYTPKSVYDESFVNKCGY